MTPAARFRAGLVVGKFSPLHLGHEWLIRQAQAQCDRLYLLSYSLPELPGCEAARREAWLQRRFPEVSAWVVTPMRVTQWRAEHKHLPDLPHNDAVDTLQRQFVAAFCRTVLQTPVDAVFTSEDYGDGFAAHLAQCFARPVAHVSIDQARQQVPISGTRLRQDVHGLRDFLAPEVYADFVDSVCLLGAESTGKSTLGHALAAALGTACVAEYGRERWVACKGQLQYPDMLQIARTQVQREEVARPGARQYLICDTSPLTTLFYSQALFGRTDPALVQLAQRRYRHLFLCADDFDLVQDGTRQDVAFRHRQQAWYLKELARRGWAYQLLRGPPQQRLEQALATLAGC